MKQPQICEHDFCESPIFIIGAHRSGTTALAAALSLHSQLWASDETFFLFDLFSNKRGEACFKRWQTRPSSAWLRSQKVTEQEFMRFLGSGFNALFSSRSYPCRWVDHTPHHALMADTLATMFPSAQFIHLLRDGRKVVSSMTNIDGTLSAEESEKMLQSGFLPKWSSNFRAACKAWDSHVTAAMNFCENFPQRSLTIRHEQLESDASTTLKQIFDFLEISPESAPAEYLTRNRVNSSFSSPTKAAGKTRPKPWEDWTPEQKEIFAEEAKSTMIRCQYCTDGELVLNEYDDSLLAMKELVSNIIPKGANVCVVSKGDPAMVQLEDVYTSHFPQDASGEYFGGSPADSEDAIRHLKHILNRNVEYLLFPKSGFWWFEYYPEFDRHLKAGFQILWEDSLCRIYDLKSPRTSSPLTLLNHTKPFSNCEAGALSGLNKSCVESFSLLMNDKPRLHFWGGQWQYGGLSNEVLESLFRLSMTYVESGGACILETGAGLSTLAFLCSRPAKLITIAPNESLKARLFDQVKRMGLDNSTHEFYVDFSENVFPRLVQSENLHLDIALIDGGHGLPTVFVDFCYANSLLREGGYVVIDDIQLYSVRQLYLLLCNQPGYEVVEEGIKTACFRKMTTEKFLPDWEGQPFLSRRFYPPVKKTAMPAS